MLAGEIPGSPVCAGIDPDIDTLEGKVTGFPRMCGDRPYRDQIGHLAHAVPPYVRG